MEKSALTKQTIRYFWRHALKHKGYLAGVLLTVPFAVLFLAFMPSLIIAKILQRISTHGFVHGQLWQSFGLDLLGYAGSIFLGGIVLWRVAVYFEWKLEWPLPATSTARCLATWWTSGLTFMPTVSAVLWCRKRTSW